MYVFFRTCDQILRINSIDVSHADKATILHLLHSATKPLRLVSLVVIVFVIGFSWSCTVFMLWMMCEYFAQHFIQRSWNS